MQSDSIESSVVLKLRFNSSHSMSDIAIFFSETYFFKQEDFAEKTNKKSKFNFMLLVLQKIKYFKSRCSVVTPLQPPSEKMAASRWLLSPK